MTGGAQDGVGCYGRDNLLLLSCSGTGTHLLSCNETMSHSEILLS